MLESIDRLCREFDGYYVEPKKAPGSDEVTAVLRLASVHVKRFLLQ